METQRFWCPSVTSVPRAKRVVNLIAGEHKQVSAVSSKGSDSRGARMRRVQRVQRRFTLSWSNLPRAKNGASVREGAHPVFSEHHVACASDRQVIRGGRSKKKVCRPCRAKISAILDLTGCCGTLDLWSATAAAIKAPIRLFGVHLFDAEQKLWHHAFLKLGIDQSVLRVCARKITQQFRHVSFRIILGGMQEKNCSMAAISRSFDRSRFRLYNNNNRKLLRVRSKQRPQNSEKGNRKRWTHSRGTAMEPGYVYIGWFAIGAAEWFLALARTVACIQRRPALVCGIVFIENLVGLLVLSIFIRENDWVIALAYSAGAALGSVLPLIQIKEVRKSPAAAGYR
jgi:hypothetical protein